MTPATRRRPTKAHTVTPSASYSFTMRVVLPEIAPELVPKNVSVIATGRSDYPNQINNVLCFPGIFKGALSVRAREINEPMKLAAAKAIASIVTSDELSTEYIIPSVFDRRVATAVAKPVARAAIRTGVARRGGRSASAIAGDIVSRRG